MNIIHKIVALIMIIVCPMSIFMIWVEENTGTLTMKIIATIYFSLLIIGFIYLYFKGEDKC